MVGLDNAFSRNFCFDSSLHTLFLHLSALAKRSSSDIGVFLGLGFPLFDLPIFLEFVEIAYDGRPFHILLNFLRSP